MNKGEIPHASLVGKSVDEIKKTLVSSGPKVIDAANEAMPPTPEKTKLNNSQTAMRSPSLSNLKRKTDSIKTMNRRSSKPHDLSLPLVTLPDGDKDNLRHTT